MNSHAGASLPSVATEQLTLTGEGLDGVELLLCGTPERAQCNAAHLARHLAEREAILADLAVGLGVRTVAVKHGRSPKLVRALRRQAEERGEIAPLKERLGRKALAISEDVLDELGEDIEKIPANVRALAFAQLVDKGMLLTGGATQRIEHVQSSDSPEAYSAWMRSLVAAGPVVEGDVSVHKGSAVGGLVAAPAAIDVEALAVGQNGVARDIKSLASYHATEESAGAGAGCGKIEGQNGGAEGASVGADKGSVPVVGAGDSVGGAR